MKSAQEQEDILQFPQGTVSIEKKEEGYTEKESQLDKQSMRRTFTEVINKNEAVKLSLKPI